LRQFLNSPEVNKIHPPGRDYLAARMVDGKPELHYMFTPEGMWCNFKHFGDLKQPRAIKYLKRAN